MIDQIRFFDSLNFTKSQASSGAFNSSVRKGLPCVSRLQGGFRGTGNATSLDMRGGWSHWNYGLEGGYVVTVTVFIGDSGIERNLLLRSFLLDR